MPRARTHCGSCPAVTTKTNQTPLMRPLFLDEASAWPPSDLQTQHQARALREAIAPYLCLDDLRRLAASGARVQDALKRVEGLPEEGQALMSLLQVLLTPSADECIRQPADLAALLMLEMGHHDHAEFSGAGLETQNAL